MDSQRGDDGADVKVHDAPPLVLMYMPSPETVATAASLEPSDEDVMECQPKNGADVKVHDAPPLVLMYMPPK